MKIIIIRKECGFFKGGAERYCMALCTELASLGHKVYVLSNKCEKDVPGNIKHIYVPVNNRSSSTKNLSFHQNCQKVLKEIRPDWSYALSRTYPVDAFRVSDPLHARWMKVRYPNRFVRRLQELNPRHRAILSLEDGIFDPQNTRLIITNSKLAKKHVTNAYNFPDHRIHVVYNGVDLDRFKPGTTEVNKEGEKKYNELTILFVSMDFKRKGLDFLLKSLFSLQKEKLSFKLVVVGNGKRKKYQKKVRELGLGSCVEFVGEVSNVETYYRTADIFVLPTRYDPFANVCLEALACGTPVITTENNGASELITESVDGYVIRGSSGIVEELSKKIYDFYRLPIEKKKEMKRQARSKAKNYSIKQNALRTIDIFERELEKRR